MIRSVQSCHNRSSLHISIMRLLIFTFSLSLLCVGCGNNSHSDNKVAGVSRNLINTPDSNTIISDNFYDEFSGEINEKTADDILILSQEKFRKGKSFLTIDKFDDTIDYYDRVKDSVALLKMYYLASVKMMHKRERDSAAIFLKKALDLSSDTSKPSKTELYTELSNLYARPSFEKDYVKSIKFAKLALSSATSPEDKARAKHDIGLFYSFINQNDSALIYLEDALNEIDPENELYTAIALNYGNTPQDNFKKSVAYLKSIKGESLGKLITLGFIYLNNSKIDSALNYCSQSKKLFYENPGKYSTNTYNSLRLLEQSLNLLKTGVINYYDGAVTNDSISELAAIKKIVSEEQREYNDKLMISLLKQKAYKIISKKFGL